MDGNCIENEHQAKIVLQGPLSYPASLYTLKGYIEYERSLKKPIYSVSSGRSSWLMLLVAIAAIHRPGAIGLEGNLTCLPALCASGIVHLSWAAVVAATVSASVSLHLDSLTFRLWQMQLCDHIL